MSLQKVFITTIGLKKKTNFFNGYLVTWHYNRIYCDAGFKTRSKKPISVCNDIQKLKCTVYVIEGNYIDLFPSPNSDIIKNVFKNVMSVY